jgi:hypothetical protein
MQSVMAVSPLAFNAVFRELVTLVKNETRDKALKNAVKSKHRVWNAASPALALDFHERLAPTYPAVLESGLPAGAVLIADLAHGDVLSSLDPEFSPRANALAEALFALSMAAHVSDEDHEACVAAHSAVQRALADATFALEDVVIDEDLAAFVRGAGARLAETGGACGLPCAPTGFEGMEDNAIMSIARDISSGIDPDMLSKPDGMAALVQTVSTGIGQRISSGELDPASLMKDASAMLASVDIAQVMKMMGGMGMSPEELAGLAAKR